MMYPRDTSSNGNKWLKSGRILPLLIFFAAGIRLLANTIPLWLLPLFGWGLLRMAGTVRG